MAFTAFLRFALSVFFVTLVLAQNGNQFGNRIMAVQPAAMPTGQSKQKPALFAAVIGSPMNGSTAGQSTQQSGGATGPPRQQSSPFGSMPTSQMRGNTAGQSTSTSSSFPSSSMITVQSGAQTTNSGTSKPTSSKSATSAQGIPSAVVTSFKHVLEKLKKDTKPEISKCPLDTVSFVCGPLVGIFYKWGDHPFKKVADKNALNELPLRVLEKKTLLVAVCNYGNIGYKGQPGLTFPLIPTLVNGVGKESKVLVQVTNSANVYAYSNLSFEEKSLISYLVVGKIHDEATVRVSLVTSGNVKLGKGVTLVHASKSALIGPVLGFSNTECIKEACITVDVKGSANILGVEEPNAAIKFDESTLIYSLIPLKCLYETTVRAMFDDSACVLKVKELKWVKSVLVHKVLIVGEAKESKISLGILKTGVVHAGNSLEFNLAALISQALILAKSKETITQVGVRDSANVFGEKAEITMSRLLDQVAIVGNTEKSVFHMSIEKSANLMTKEKSNIEVGSACIGIAVGIQNLLATLNVVKISHSGNVRAGMLSIKHDSALIIKAIAAKNVSAVALVADVIGSGNVATSDAVELDKSCLIDELIQVDDAEGPIKAKLETKFSANALCGKGLYPVLKLMNKAMLLKAALKASFKTKHPMMVNANLELGYVGNSFIKTHGDDGLVGSVFDVSEAGADDVEIDQKSVGKLLKCETLEQ